MFDVLNDGGVTQWLDENFNTIDDDISSKTYLAQFNILVETLKDVIKREEEKTKNLPSSVPHNVIKPEEEEENENLVNLMSQAVVPRLIGRMAEISKDQRKTAKDLRNMLINNTKKDKNKISADYPYARTQIIETLVSIRKADKSWTLGNFLKTFGNPLMGTAVFIVNATAAQDEKNLADLDWMQDFSKKVNTIQDLIVRHIIFNRTPVIPLVGDPTLPATEKTRKEARKDLKNRALGLGENPNPEMAAMLNPGLVMDPEEQIAYHKELVMLSSLISPKTSKYNRSVGDAFKNAGFERSEAEVVNEGKAGEDAVKEVIDELGVVPGPLLDVVDADQDDVLETENEKLKKKDERIQMLTNEISDLKTKLLKSTLPPPTTEKPKADFASRARIFLIEYLGVKSNIFEFTKEWMELYDLEPTNAIFKSYQEDVDIKQTDDVLRIGLSSLITGNEVIGVRRQSKYYLEPQKKLGRKSTTPSVILTHAELVTLWKANKPEAEAPVETKKSRDLIILKPSFGTEAEKIALEITNALALATKISQKPSLVPSETNNITQSFASHRRRRRHQQSHLNNATVATATTRRRHNQRNREDERVLIW